MLSAVSKSEHEIMNKSSAKGILLASASPRRAELLGQIGVPFQVVTHEADETRLADEDPVQYVRRVGLAKARSVLARSENAEQLVLASDTTVVLGDRTLGKPVDEEDAVAMLLALSGRSHEVMTSVVVANRMQERLALSRTEVTFATISEAKARRYWASGEPSGKAGAYAIQGRGATFIERIHGSYSSVMGLPLFETAALLEEFGVQVN